MELFYLCLQIKSEDFQIKRDNLSIGEVINRGPYMKAILSQSFGGKSDVVVKIVRSVDKDRLGLMKSLRHENLIFCYGVCEDEHDTFIVDEWASQGDLRSYLDRLNGSCLPIEMVKMWAKQACSAIKYLHGIGCIHTDISSLKYLIMNDNTLKLSAFGYVKSWDSTKSARGLPHCPLMPPEILKAKRRSKLSDVFSLGIVVWEIITGQVPLESTKSSFNRMKDVAEGGRPVVPDKCPKLAHLLSQCWKEDYKQRPSVKDIIPLLDEGKDVSKVVKMSLRCFIAWLRCFIAW